MLAMCRFSVQGELKSTVTKNLHSLKAMWTTAVNPCKQECIILLTQLHLFCKVSPTPLYHIWCMIWVGLVLTSVPLVSFRTGSKIHRETRRIVFACGDGEARCTGAVSSVSLAAVGCPGATAVLHPERGQPLTKPWGRWATSIICELRYSVAASRLGVLCNHRQ